MSRSIDCFYPGDSFPAISITGRSCALNCKHCGRKYLEGMTPATTPDELVEIAGALAERGANGFLLSGGADSAGKVRMADFAGAIGEIKASTDLKVNVHIGLTSTPDIESLVDSNVDSFSVDVYGSDDTIHEVLGLNATVQDYLRVISDLRRSGARAIAPHICVGIHGGELRGELHAVDALEAFAPKTLILISLIPTKGTAYQDVAPPSAEMVLSVLRRAKEKMPSTKVMLGCMRSKLDRSNEFALVSAGFDGIVLPSAATVERLKGDGFKIRKRAVCCSLA